MRKYSYTVRDATGVLKRGCVEAPDRSAALTMLKAQKLQPVSLTEGGASPVSEGWRRRGIYIAALMIGLAAIMYISLTLKPTTGQAPEKTKIGKTVIPKVIQKPQPAADKEEIAAPSETVPEGQPVQSTPLEHVAAKDGLGGKSSARDMHSGQVTQSDETMTNKSQRIFTTGTEQVIGWIANARMGDPPPILPMLPAGEDIVKILDTDIVLYDEDDEKTELIKTRVAEMKQQLKSYLGAGGSPQEFLQVYQKQLRDAHDEWRMSQSELVKRLRENDRADVAVFLDERNKELMARGIKPLIIPPAFREK